MKKKSVNITKFILLIFILLGCMRFIYATSLKENISLFNSTYAEKAYNNYYIEKNTERNWGPIAITLISGINKFATKDFAALIWRIGLILSYLAIIYLLYNLITDFKLIYSNNQNHFWDILLVFFCLQSSSAIYNISNGGGEIITSLCIIGHFYFFCKKKYFIASLFIIIGIYFKFHPIIFVLPYFVFSILSKSHRIYIYNLFFVGIIFSVISYPIQGFIDGSLYPLSIIFSVAEQSSNTIPIWSQEIFNPLSLINKIIYGFKIEKSYSQIFEILPLSKFLITLFALLFILINLMLGFILSRIEYKWKNNEHLRFIHLFFLQVIIGFLYLIFSVDVSIEHLLLPLISIYAPLFLFSATINKYNDIDNIKIILIVTYLFGLILIGGILPISFVSIILPFDIIDKIVGDITFKAGDYGRFIWYHIPLIGLSIIAFVYFYYLRYILKNKI